MPLDDPRHPTLIVRLDPNVAEDGIQDLIAITRPLCELLGIVQYEHPLLLALERLHAQRCFAPSDADFASVLELDPARIAEVRSHLGGSVDRMLRLLAPLVAYQVDAQQALALLDARATIESEEDLRRAISPDRAVAL